METKTSTQEDAVRAHYLNTELPAHEQIIKKREAIQFAYHLLCQFYNKETGTYLLYNGKPRLVPSEVLVAEHVVPETIEKARKKGKFTHEIVPEYATVWVEAQPRNHPDNPLFFLHSTYLKRIIGNGGINLFINHTIPSEHQHQRELIARYFPDQLQYPDFARHDVIMQETWRIADDGTVQETLNGILGFHTHLGPDTAALPQVMFEQPILLAVPPQPSTRAINRVLLLSACAASLFSQDRKLI